MEDMTFDEISEYLEIAGNEAAQALTLELLREAVEKIGELELRLDELASRVAANESGMGAYKQSPPFAPNPWQVGTGVNGNQPFISYNTVSAIASDKTADLTSKIDTMSSVLEKLYNENMKAHISTKKFDDAYTETHKT